MHEHENSVVRRLAGTAHRQSDDSGRRSAGTPLRSVVSRMTRTMVDLWILPDPFDWTNHYLATRDKRFMLAKAIWLFWTVKTAVGFMVAADPNNIPNPWVRGLLCVMMATASLASLGISMFPHWRTRSVSYPLVILTDLGILGLTLAVVSPTFYALAALQFGLIAIYVAVMHNLRVLVVQLAFSTLWLCGLGFIRDYGGVKSQIVGAFCYLAVVPIAVSIGVVIVTQYLRTEASMVDIDPLTRVLNRYAVTRSVSALLASRDCARQGVAIALIDLDKFKSINDLYGHDGGDRVLAALGTVLTRVAHRRMIVGRLGGEEFVVALTGVDAAETLRVTLPAAIREAGLTSGVDLDRPLTASIGICVFRSNLAGTVKGGRRAAMIAEILDAADSAMYLAKSVGGDHVVVGDLTAVESAQARAKSPRAEWINQLRSTNRFERVTAHLTTMYGSGHDPLLVVRTGMVVIPTYLAIVAVVTALFWDGHGTHMISLAIGAFLLLSATAVGISNTGSETHARIMTTLAFIGATVVAVVSPFPVLFLAQVTLVGIFAAFFYRFSDVVLYLIATVVTMAAMIVLLPNPWSPGLPPSITMQICVVLSTFAIAVGVPAVLAVLIMVMEFDGRRAVIDEMTGTLNRLGLSRNLGYQAAWLRERGLTGYPLGVFLVDLDNFKSVNDTHGHSHGDAVLVNAARVLRLTLDSLGVFSFVSRAGGDEFVVVSTLRSAPSGLAGALQTGYSVATPSSTLIATAADRSIDPMVISERIRAALGAIEPGVTASIGVHIVDADLVGVDSPRAITEILGDAVSTADVLMYAAKLAGGDTVRSDVSVPNGSTLRIELPTPSRSRDDVPWRHGAQLDRAAG